MSNRQKLELTWIGKDRLPRLEPRILLEDPASSYHATTRVSGADLFDNMVIHADNLLALRALEQRFSERIRCVYIDPPFNTGQAFEHYEDGVEHSTWLSLMRDRLVVLHRLLASDGTIMVHIDDNELAYLTVLMDEVFGRSNRAYTITFKQGSPTGHKAINPGCVSTSNFILIYAKDKASWTPNRVYTARDRDKRYNQMIQNPESPCAEWEIVPLATGFAEASGISEKEAKTEIKRCPSLLDEFVTNNARSVVRLARPDYKAVSKEARAAIDASKANPDRVLHLPRDAHKDFYFVRGERILFYADKLKNIDGQLVAGEPLTTIWDDLLSNNLHKEGGVSFPKGKKPEALIKRVLELCTSPGDWVLDSFAGSGTTGATAHKMGRRWILVELGEHCQSHVLPRLRSVIDGTDTSGVTTATSWRGGGGFRFFRLACSLLEQDKWGNWVVSRDYNAAMLAEAVCKLEGFSYSPDSETFWLHGRSTERDFIYVTTQNLSRAQLQFISEEVGDDRTLLICCGSFRVKRDAFPNLTLKKIPQAVLHRCEWGRDDYSLNVESLPAAEDSGEEREAPPAQERAKKKTAGGHRKQRDKRGMQQLPLFKGKKQEEGGE